MKLQNCFYVIIRELIEIVKKELWHSLHSVSYTHLDVYKRQTFTTVTESAMKIHFNSVVIVVR